MSDVAQDEFVESLKDRLVEAGKKNVVIIEPGESSRKKAMENIAEAFSEPVKEFIDSETSQVANISIVSYDRSVDINSGVDPVTKKEITNLSVANTVNDAISNHNVDENAHEDIRQAIEQKQLAVEHDDSLFGDGTENTPLGVVIDKNIDPGSTNPVENRAVDAALNGKQDQLTEMTDQEVSDLIEALN